MSEDKTTILIVAVVIVIAVISAIVASWFFPISALERARIETETIIRSISSQHNLVPLLIVSLAAGAILSAIVPLAQNYLDRRRARGREETTEQRISRLTKSLSESIQLINEIGEEIDRRQALASKLQNDVKEYEELAKLEKSQVEAVVQALDRVVQREGRRSILRDFALNFIFFILGLVAMFLWALR